jgi:hypothetical protein
MNEKEIIIFEIQDQFSPMFEKEKQKNQKEADFQA